MEIKAKQIIVDRSTSYKYYKPKFCCKALEENPRIVISNEYPDNYLCRTCETIECHGCDYKTDETFGIFFYISEEVQDWEDTWPEDYYYPLKFCPFCGEPIEVDVIETIDKTEEAEKVSEVATKLRKQLWACDSKKKCAELEKETRNLDDIVNYYYSTGEIDENRENQKIVEK